MRLVPFEPEHIGRMRLAAREAEALAAWGDPSTLATLYAGGGFARSALAGEQIVAAGGLFVLRPGVAEAWLIRSADLAAYRIAVARLILSALNEALQVLRLHRVQAVVPVDSAKARRFAEWLGFVPEGVMRRYSGDGSDSILYSKV